MARRFFYVVYFDDTYLQAILDIMRLVANPEEKTLAHITVRGPYSQRYNVEALGRQICGTKVLAEGIGAFLNEGQNTIFIKCSSEELRRVWKKKDFGFNPHITIYDGQSRTLAEKIFRRLSHLDIHFKFSVSTLNSLETHKGQQSFMLRHAIRREVVEQVAGRVMSVSEIEQLSEDDRAALVELFAKELPRFPSFLAADWGRSGWGTK